MFSGSFGVRSIVLCKCSGKYIDIYFKLKITFLHLLLSFGFLLFIKNIFSFSSFSFSFMLSVVTFTGVIANTKVVLHKEKKKKINKHKKESCLALSCYGNGSLLSVFQIGLVSY